MFFFLKINNMVNRKYFFQISSHDHTKNGGVFFLFSLFIRQTLLHCNSITLTHSLLWRHHTKLSYKSVWLVRYIYSSLFIKFCITTRKLYRETHTYLPRGRQVVKSESFFVYCYLLLATATKTKVVCEFCVKITKIDAPYFTFPLLLRNYCE